MKVLKNRRFAVPIGTHLWRAFPFGATTKHGEYILTISDTHGYRIVCWTRCYKACSRQRRICCKSGVMIPLLRVKRRISGQCIDCINVDFRPTRFAQTVWLTEGELQRLIRRRLVHNHVADYYYRHNRLNQLPEVWHNYQPPDMVWGG